MGYSISFSPSARRNLRDIVRYISLDSPERAVSFGQFLISNTKRLGKFTELGRVVPEFEDESIREIVVRSYRIIYRLDRDACRVDVLRLWHGARGTPTIDER